MEGQKGKKKEFASVFTSEEEFVKEAEKVFRSLKDRNPFSFGVSMGHDNDPLEVDVQWRITPRHSRHWTRPQLEFILSVLASRQTRNVKETQLNLHDNYLGSSAELFPKLANLTYLNIGSHGLSVISPLIGELIHIRELNLGGSRMSTEGFAIVCELFKV